MSDRGRGAMETTPRSEWKGWVLHSAIAVIQAAVVVAIIAFAIWVIVSATSYNTSRAELCERHGLAFGSQFMGDYGCVEVHPFEEIEQMDEEK